MTKTCRPHSNQQRVLTAPRVRQGVFPPHTAPSLKIVPVLQGSADGVSWLDYEWRDMICDVKRPPPFVAPRQPRVDYKLFYEVRNIILAGVSAAVLLSKRSSCGACRLLA